MGIQLEKKSLIPSKFPGIETKNRKTRFKKNSWKIPKKISKTTRNKKFPRKAFQLNKNAG